LFRLGVVADHLARADGLPRGDERLRKPLVDREEVVRMLQLDHVTRLGRPEAQHHRAVVDGRDAVAGRRRDAYPEIAVADVEAVGDDPLHGFGQLDRLAYRTPRPAAAAR